MQDTKQYELDELLTEANRLRKADPELANTAPFNSRTIYYYVQEGLLPGRSGRRGPGTRYSQQFLYKLLLIRRLQKETTLKLSDIREVMERIQPDSLQAVALGVESIEVASVTSHAEAAQVAQTREDRTILLRSTLDKGAENTPHFDASESDGQMLREIAPSMMRRSVPAPAATQEHYENYSPSMSNPEGTAASVGVETTFPLGDNAELVIRQPLTGKQMRQLENIAQLIADILDE